MSAPPPSSTLSAVWKHIDSRCSQVSAAFMACKAADANPETCLKQGAAVTACAVELCGHTNLANAQLLTFVGVQAQGRGTEGG
jgi:hypothetical protein